MKPHDYTRFSQEEELMNPSITPRLKSRGINKGHTEPPPSIRGRRNEKTILEPPPLIRTINGTVLRRECIKRYKEGYRKKPEQIQEIKAIEKAGIETLTKEHWYKTKE